MKVLVIGSTVVDVILNVYKMPLIGEDENIIQQSLSIGGCAFNVFHTLKYLDVDCELFSPVGKGIYGNYIKDYFYKHHIPISIESLQDNGCCYCIVDQNGERTFLAYHGAEYIFQKQWFELLKNKQYDMIYVCGLELEEKTGQYLVEFLKTRKEQIYFAPSSRFDFIQKEIIDDIFSLKPIIHLSKNEILSYTKQQSVETAAIHLYQKTMNTIIVTLGEKGCYYYDGKHHYIDGFSIQVVDTIGAGDCHLAALMAYQIKGYGINEALKNANRLAAKVVAVK
ncbi:MAG: PfkB family carbohydrate kinase, partial [Succinatimonas sp.]|nr:PfkB family carbohydrate kinase [Succinatimonas sp.]